jgi:L,D-transpeptidase YcbB
MLPMLARLALACLLLTAAVPNFAWADDGEDASAWLRQRLVSTARTAPAGAPASEQKLYRFYAARDFRLAWSAGDDGLSPQAEALRRALLEAEADGLPASDYAVDAIERRWPAEAAEDRAELDLLLTRAFLRYAADARGVVDPRGSDAGWQIEPPDGDDVASLEQALRSPDFAAALRAIESPHAEHARLRWALTHYRRIAAEGGWPTLPHGPALELGVRDERVPLLRARLTLSGDLRAPTAAAEATAEAATVAGGTGALDEGLFDTDLGQAVRRFQERHGLEPDGVVGPRTRAALNVTAAERADRILVNLERWRWMPRDLGRRHLLVNTAGFRLDYVEDGEPTLGMRVIVGKEGWGTPSFADRMTHIVLNPYWNVPPSIARGELLPKLREDPAAVAADGMRVFAGWDRDAAELDPLTVDWAAVPPGRGFPYRLRQDPGPKNPLGRMKFMFPNEHSIYLHDTPNRSLFRRAFRAFSHGCIRVEEPVRLASALLGWAPERIEAALAKGENAYVRLPEQVPVYLTYFTAWVEPDGTVQFRDDIYGRDANLLAALARPAARLAWYTP